MSSRWADVEVCFKVRLSSVSCAGPIKGREIQWDLNISSNTFQLDGYDFSGQFYGECATASHSQTGGQVG
jgi:hypothetical protein